MTARVTFSPPSSRSTSSSSVRIIWHEISSGGRLRPSASHSRCRLPSPPSTSRFSSDASATASEASLRARPMRRLTDAKVLFGLRSACSHAAWPTSMRTSPSAPPSTRSNDTTDGVVDAPILFLMMIGLPSTSAATAELVVPRSIPTDRPNGGALLLPGATASTVRSAACRTPFNPTRADAFVPTLTDPCSRIPKLGSWHESWDTNVGHAARRLFV
mmetsp:Transcript_43276/g.69575  ORF Transcript_43276/g.69575 Transcript_43276/m.69575 type:complete len:216 (+) Transcript_43276:537-1184(+)